MLWQAPSVHNIPAINPMQTAVLIYATTIVILVQHGRTYKVSLLLLLLFCTPYITWLIIAGVKKYWEHCVHAWMIIAGASIT